MEKGWIGVLVWSSYPTRPYKLQDDPPSNLAQLGSSISLGILPGAAGYASNTVGGWAEWTALNATKWCSGAQAVSLMGLGQRLASTPGPFEAHGGKLLMATLVLFPTP